MNDISELKNKPLVEALFEIRWTLNGPPGLAVDPNYQLLVGQLYSKLKTSFPFHIMLPSADVPAQFIPFTPQHQFRVAPDKWPLVQLGSGLLSFHDTENYLWDSFFTNCKSTVNAFFDVYPSLGTTSSPLQIGEISLRYIDADLLLGTDPLAFLEKLKITISLSDKLFDGSTVSKKPSGLGLMFSFPINDPDGILQLSINRGRKGDEDAMVWETQVISRGQDAPQSGAAISEWLNKAHDITHKWFAKQIEGELLEKYR